MRVSAGFNSGEGPDGRNRSIIPCFPRALNGARTPQFAEEDS